MDMGIYSGDQVNQRRLQTGGWPERDSFGEMAVIEAEILGRSCPSFDLHNRSQWGNISKVDCAHASTIQLTGIMVTNEGDHEGSKQVAFCAWRQRGACTKLVLAPVL